jgi:hypothetical protein
MCRTSCQTEDRTGKPCTLACSFPVRCKKMLSFYCLLHGLLRRKLDPTLHHSSSLLPVAFYPSLSLLLFPCYSPPFSVSISSLTFPVDEPPPFSIYLFSLLHLCLFISFSSLSLSCLPYLFPFSSFLSILTFAFHFLRFSSIVLFFPFSRMSLLLCFSFPLNSPSPIPVFY